MKKLIIIIAAFAFILFGCQDENSLVEPSANFAVQNLTKGKPVKNDDLTLNSNDDVRSHYAKTYTIDGKKGGRIRETHTWLDSSGNSVVMEAYLTIPRNAFEGKLTFDIIFDLENLSVELYPSPYTFDKPVLLDLLFEGVDLSGFDTSNMEFEYQSPDGTTYEVLYESKTIEANYLEVVQAQLPHFSRYGWTR